MIEAKETFAFQQLDVYVAAKEFARLVENARISDKELRDQATRAATSLYNLVLLSCRASLSRPGSSGGERWAGRRGRRLR